MRNRLLFAVAVAVGLALLTGCAPASDPAGSDARPVTAAEAELLAAARFRNFDAGTRSVTFDVDEDGAELHVDGWFDYVANVGYGVLVVDGEPSALTVWNPTLLAAHAPPSSDVDDPAPLPIPDSAPLDDTWQRAPLTSGRSRLQSMLQVIASLGADRPDNPLLLRQGGALALGDETIDGEVVSVFAGPRADTPPPEGQDLDPEASTTRFWLDRDGTMRRVAVRLGGSGTWQDIDFGGAAGVDLGNPFAEGAPDGR